MKVSVILPTCQGERYIVETLNSIAAQTRLPDELVVSVDESTDNTHALCARFATEAPFVVTVLSHKRQGISANYMHALEASNGDIVLVADHDDIWKPERIERVLDEFSRDNKITVVSVDSEICDQNMNPTGLTLRGGTSRSARLSSLVRQDDFVEFLKGLRLDAHTLAFRSMIKSALASIKDIEAPDFWFENKVVYAALSVGKLALIADALTLYRQHPSQHIGHKGINQTLVHHDFSHANKLLILRSLLLDMKNDALLDEKEIDGRLACLKQYLEFQNIRHPEVAGIRSAAAILGALMAGKYQRFARRGMLSAAKDLVMLTRRRSRLH